MGKQLISFGGNRKTATAFRKVGSGMARKDWGLPFGLVGALVIGNATIALLENRACAQIAPDVTLGVESSIVTPNVNIKGISADRIEGGALRGTNLFHSFQEFNVGDGQRVYFANPVGIENILSRVTGNNISNILGTLGVDGGANLFLLNPNGIIFGPNAKLDIAGSFVASTADSLVFENNSKFSATNPEAPPLLTISLTPGLQYGSNQPRATITNAGNLSVGQNLTLDAGNLDLQGQLQAGRDLTLQAQDTVKVRDSAINPFVAAAGGRLLIQGNQTVDIFALNHPMSGFYSGEDMVLRSVNPVGGDAHYWSGGNFRIEQLDGSLGNLSSPNDPVIRANGNVFLASYTGASLHILAGGRVEIPGSVLIQSSDPMNGIVEDVPLSNGTSQPINGQTRPTLDIRAGINWETLPGDTITGVVFPPPVFGGATNADIRIGDIAIEAPNGLVFLTNQYQPNTAVGNIQVSRIRTGFNPFGGFSGDAGSIVIDSRGNITIPDSGTIRTDATTGKAGDITLLANGSFFMTGRTQLAALALGQGDAGNINIVVGDSVFMTGNAQMAAFTGAQGDAGNINIVAGNAVSLNGDSFISTDVRAGAVGNGGDINIEAGALLIDGNASLQADSIGPGNAGNIIVQVKDSVSLTNGGFISSSALQEGNGGNIQINAPASVIVSGFNPVSGRSSALLAIAGRNASGQAGSIAINTGTLRVADGAAINTSTFSSSNGGSVAINANNLELTGGGQVLALTRSSGKAGNVNLNVTDTVTISEVDPNYLNRLTQFGSNVVTNELDASGIFAGGSIFGSTGNGGDLSISTRRLNLSDEGAVTTAVFGTGEAGNLAIAAVDSVNVSSKGSITTASSQGNSGNLSINTRQLNVSDVETVLTTGSGGGNAGELSIIATDSMNVSNQGVVTTATGESSTGNSGNLSILTGRLTISNAGKITSSSLGRGNAGNLAITATDSVSVGNGSFLSTGTEPTSAGNGGTLSINTRQLDIKDGGQIDTASTGTGNSGNLAIASDSMNVVNQSVVTTSSAEGAGVAGRLDIQTGRLSIRDGSLVVSSTVGSGDAGDLTVRAADFVEVVNNSKLSADTVGSGNAANLTIETNNFSIQDSEVSTGTLPNSSGRGGTLSVRASGVVEIDGSGGLVTGTAGSGSGGDLSVTTRRLTAQDGGRVEAGTAGTNGGGDVTVNASELIELSGGSADGISPSGVSAKSGAASTVGSGNVNLTTGELIVRDGAEVTVETLGAGNGGKVGVQANSLSLANGGSIASRSRGQGRAGDISVSLNENLRSSGGIISATSTQAGGGDITIEAKDIRLRNGSLISTSVFDSTGGGGDISIKSDVFLALEDSDILANADAGPGGNITINSSAFLIDLFSTGQAAAVGRNPGNLSRFRGNARVDISDNFAGVLDNRLIDISDDFAGFLDNRRVDISADSRTNSSGIVSIPNIFSPEVASLPSNFVNAAELIDRRCTADNRTRRGSFTVTGRGGLPPSPTDPLTGEAMIADWITLNSEDENRDRTGNHTNPTHSNPQQLVEAQGWVINNQGQVILTATTSTVTLQNFWLASPSCQSAQPSTQ